MQDTFTGWPSPYSIPDHCIKGTKKVKVDGGNSAAIKGSEYSRCNGDEPGTLGGVVSSTNMKEATWILSSFDVKLEGKNACRLSDMMMMNHGNTACLSGTLHAPVPTLDSCDKAGLDKLACECNKAINNSPKDGGPCPDSPWGNASSNPGGSDCTTLGTKKHQCCEDSINEHAEENPECDFQSEVVFPEGAKNSKEKAKEAYDKKKQGYIDNGRTEAQATGYCRRDNVYSNALYDNGAKCIADVVQGNPPTAAFDFKFNCADEGTMGKTQIQKYQTYTGCTPEMIHADGRACEEEC